MRKKIRLDPKAMSKLAELAGVIESPFPSIENIHGHVLASTNRQWFESQITGIVQTAHTVAAYNSTRKIKTDRRIGPLARQLARAVRASDAYYLSYFLPSGSTVDSCIAAVNDLANAAQRIGKLKKAKRKGKLAETSRKTLVEQLLDAAHEAGGKFRLNRRSERGSLVEALDLLAPYLPAEFSKGRSVATLRRIRDSWLKNTENKEKRR